MNHFSSPLRMHVVAAHWESQITPILCSCGRRRRQQRRQRRRRTHGRPFFCSIVFLKQSGTTQHSTTATLESEFIFLGSEDFGIPRKPKWTLIIPNAIVHGVCGFWDQNQCGADKISKAQPNPTTHTQALHNLLRVLLFVGRWKVGPGANSTDHFAQCNWLPRSNARLTNNVLKCCTNRIYAYLRWAQAVFYIIIVHSIRALSTRARLLVARQTHMQCILTLIANNDVSRQKTNNARPPSRPNSEWSVSQSHKPARIQSLSTNAHRTGTIYYLFVHTCTSAVQCRSLQPRRKPKTN